MKTMYKFTFLSLVVVIFAQNVSATYYYTPSYSPRYQNISYANYGYNTGDNGGYYSNISGAYGANNYGNTLTTLPSYLQYTTQLPVQNTVNNTVPVQFSNAPFVQQINNLPAQNTNPYQGNYQNILTEIPAISGMTPYAPNVGVTYTNQGFYPSNIPMIFADSTYPGCSRPDILVGGQKWASCNALDRRTGSDTRSGWFFPGEMYSLFVSDNGIGQRMDWQGRKPFAKSWNFGPCSVGYRLPTRGEWETANMYAKQNNTTIANLLKLPYNASFMAYRDNRNWILPSARLNLGGAYWTASVAGETPYVLHLGSSLGGYRTDGTESSPSLLEYRWQNTENGLEMVASDIMELANVRCIKDL